jgi:Acetyl-CoA acetyltransferase
VRTQDGQGPAVGELVYERARDRALGGIGRSAPGEGGPLAASGATTIGGRLPLNPSGGLESKGHPLAATGLAQIYELVQQLRGEAGARQVENARIALAENGGGFYNGEEAVCAITILAAG